MKKLLASLLVGGFIACGVPALAYQGIDDVCQTTGLKLKLLQ